MRRTTQRKVSCKIVQFSTQHTAKLSLKSKQAFTPGFSGFKALQEVDDIRDLYQFKKILGSGSFGTVYSGTLKKTGTPVAIKTISKSQLKKRANWNLLKQLLDEELRLLTLLEHPHIVRTLSLCEDEEKYYIS